MGSGLQATDEEWLKLVREEPVFMERRREMSGEEAIRRMNVFSGSRYGWMGLYCR